MPKDLEDRVALVTGASRGIGMHTARLLAEHGARVAVNFRQSEKDAQAVVRHIKTRTDAIAIKADVSDAQQCKMLVQDTIAYFNGLDILVNNAGVAVYRPFEQMSVNMIKDVIDTNLTGLMCVTQEALRHMKAQGSGVIINISSGAGKHGMAGLAAYCASKFGVVGFTEALGRELEETIRVYCVCPGGVDTDMFHNLFPGTAPERLIPPEKIAKLVVALCTGKKKLKNGESVNVYW